MASPPQEPTQDKIWTGLAEELIHRADVRPRIKDRLKQALELASPERRGQAIRTALSEAIASHRRDAANVRKTSARTPQPQQLAAAKQALSLVNHGLERARRVRGPLPARLCRFLRDAVLTYSHAHAAAGAPADLEPAEKTAERLLDGLANRQTMGRTARVGVLTPDEVSGLASGRVRPSQTPTVVATGDLERDLGQWRQSNAVPESRRRALAQGEFGDGEYLLAVIQPTERGQSVEVYPIAASGQPRPQPVARYRAPRAAELVPAAAVVAASAVRSERPAQGQPTPLSTKPLLDQLPKSDIAAAADIGQAAVSINQTRVALYADALRRRPDLRGAARRAAERRLERMQGESERLASTSASPRQLRRFLAQWSKELSRDMQRFAAQLDDPRDAAFGEQLSALSRMGALQTRLDGLLATVSGLEPSEGAFWGLTHEARELVRPDQPTDSIFDTLPGPRVSAAGLAAARRAVAGEELSTRVVLRDAERSEKPSTRSRQIVRGLARDGQALRQALTTAMAMQQSGLGMSSDLVPLLRPKGMPAVVAPDTRSPMLRNFLLPAMERVSGTKRTLARRGGDAPAGPTSPAELFGAVMGEEGLSLIDKAPEMARDLLAQMGELTQKLESMGSPPTLSTLEKAGKAIRERVSAISFLPDEPSESSGEKGGAAAAVGESMGVVTGGPPSLQDAGEAAVGELAGALEAEGAELASELKAQIEPFVEVGAGTRVFSGAVASAALDEMGALGATVGKDVYVHKRVLAKGGKEAAAVVGHELAHVHLSRLGYRSLQEEESRAYEIEEAIREKWELAEERRSGSTPPTQADPAKESEDQSKKDQIRDALVEKVSELWAAQLDRFDFIKTW